MTIELNKIYNMDCLEGMKQIPNESVDLVVADPPYGIDVCKNGVVGIKGASKPKEYGVCAWDNERINKEYFDEIFRISKNQIIFGGNYYTDYLIPSSSWIVWDKKNDESTFADCELIWTSFEKAIRIYRHRWHGMLQENMRKKERHYHPTQKPLPLIEWILKKYTRKGDVICDPFIGSGTTAVACKRLGFDFIGFEIDKKYCDIAQERLDNVPEKLEAFL